MKKKVLSLVLSILLIVSIFPIGIIFAGAENAEPITGTCGENLQWTFDGARMIISKTDENLESGDMDDYNYYYYDHSNTSPWAAIRDRVNNVVIKEGVTSIGNYAFYKFANLRVVTIPNTVTKIGAGAFNECTSLTEITIPGSVETIDSFFLDCDNLKSITIEEGVKLIKADSLTGLRNLLTLTIPESAEIEKIVYEGNSHPYYAFNNNYGNDRLIVYGSSNAKEYIKEMRNDNISHYFESQKRQKEDDDEDKDLLFMKIASYVNAITDVPTYVPISLKSDFTTNLVLNLNRSRIVAILWLIPIESFVFTMVYMVAALRGTGV